VRAVSFGLVASASVISVQVAAAAAGAPVEIVITKVRDGQGIVHVELCPEKLFLKVCPYVGEAQAQTGTTIVRIPNVPPGRYAAQAYHDRNHNGHADRNFLGLPTEDVGFSNNALTALARPKFSVAAFDHGSAPQRITFEMRGVLH
jgi:uncharacterized protein (DUF2141 family)